MLKIIGIVVLVLLAVLFLILFTVLLIPVRYSLSGSFYGKVKGRVKITWLLHGVSVTGTYEDGPEFTVRLLGKRLFHWKMSVDEAEEEAKDIWDEIADEGDDVPDMDETKTQGGWTEEEGKVYKGQEEWETDREKPKEPASSPNTKKKSSGRQKAAKGIKDRIESVKEKGKNLVDYKDRVTAFLTEEENQKTLKLIFCQCKALIRHILPVKIKGTVVFGFDDPSVTGNVLACLSVLYPWYGKTVSMVPVFDQKILEGEGSLKGRLRGGTMAVLLLRILLNKNFRLLLRRWRRNGGII